MGWARWRIYQTLRLPRAPYGANNTVKGNTFDCSRNILVLLHKLSHESHYTATALHYTAAFELWLSGTQFEFLTCQQFLEKNPLRFVSHMLHLGHKISGAETLKQSCVLDCSTINLQRFFAVQNISIGYLVTD